MKKIIFYPAILLLSVIAVSFKAPKSTNEIIITVSAAKPTKFDMNQDGKLTKGLVTPYKITITSNDAKFIFKSAKHSSGINIDVAGGNGILKADWATTVVIISPTGISTFGMD
jgi:hypothetical protein